MGADLYITKISRKCREKYDPLFNAACKERDKYTKYGMKNLAEKAQEEVTKYYNLSNSEGYFRDSYNGTALLQYLNLDDNGGLSWWQDIVPLQNKNGDIVGENLDKFYQIILAADLVLPTKEQLIENNCTVEGTGENSVKGWHQYLIGKRDKLLNFIALAIEMNEPIHASL